MRQSPRHFRLSSNEGMTTATENSDADSVSTTSASYVVNHSDAEDASKMRQEEGARSYADAKTTCGNSSTGEEPKEEEGAVTLSERKDTSDDDIVLLQQNQQEKESSPVIRKEPQAGRVAQSQEKVPTEQEGEEEEADPVVSPTPTSGKKRKKSVLALIARFEGGSGTEQRSARSLTPEVAAASNANRNARAKSLTVASSAIAEEREELVEKEEEEGELTTKAEKGDGSGANDGGAKQVVGDDDDHSGGVAVGKSEREGKSKEDGADNDNEPLELGEAEGEGEDLPLGAEAINPDFAEQLVDEEGNPITEEMAKTLGKRQGYTSYVFISSNNDGKSNDNDDVASVASSVRSARSNRSGDSNKVVVNVKEPGGSCVVLQDGRASNISIVSTESSELGSPHSPENLNGGGGQVPDDDRLFLPQPVPDLPAKARNRNGEVVDLAYHFGGPLDPYRRNAGGSRSRGGEDYPDERLDQQDPVEEEEDDSLLPEERISSSPNNGDGGDNSLTNYFTSSLDSPSSTPSRRGRPPVIRAADRLARSRSGGAGVHQEYPEEGDYLEDRRGDVQYLDEYGDYVQEYDEQGNPIIHDGVEYVDMYDDGHYHNDYHHDGDYDPRYDVRYEGDSGDSFHDEADDGRRDYPMCQPVYVDDSEEYVSGDGSGDEYLDREEELRGYNRQIDFTLHTIIEESCEDSDQEPRSMDSAVTGPGGNRGKRLSDPSELEKYFFYGVGGGQEEAGSDEAQSENSLNAANNPDEDSLMTEEESASRYEQYFRSGLVAGNNGGAVDPSQSKSLDLVSSGRNTDDSGSVGSESDGQRSPGPNKKKKIKSKSGFYRSGESDNNYGTADEDGQHSYSGSSDDNLQLSSSDGQDTMKRKKAKARRAKLQQQQQQQPSESEAKQQPLEGPSPKATPPITPLPSQIIEVMPAATEKSVSPTGSEKGSSLKKPLGRLGSNSPKDKQSPSTTPPPSTSANVMRKHKSRDSGFVGSTDDLLLRESAPGSMASSLASGHGNDSQQSLSAGSSDGENSNNGTGERLLSSIGQKQSRLEKVSEVSENTEDDAERTPTKHNNSSDDSNIKVAKAKADLEARLSGESEGKKSAALSRKDSFHNWSSDEDTNIMMNRMRNFFKGIIQGYSGGNANQEAAAAAAAKKSEQIVALEEQLARLMRTVPGINEEQVREIVEYLSSEDTWSDSYDSSDYTSTSDMENRYPDIPDLANLDAFDTEAAAHLRKQISASCQEIIQKFDMAEEEVPSVSAVDREDFEKETELMYQKLMARMRQNQLEEEQERLRQQQQQQQQQQRSKSKNVQSPPIAAKMMHHISSRLVALMHEVSAAGSSDNSSSPSSLTGEKEVKKVKGSARFRRTEKDSESGNLTFSSIDSPKGMSKSQPKPHPTSSSLVKSPSKSVELLDSAGKGGRRKSLEDSARNAAASLRKDGSRSEYDVWKGAHRDSPPGTIGAASGAAQVAHAHPSHRRGSLGQKFDSHHSSSSGVSDLINDDERWSWKGSFDSALATGERAASARLRRSGDASSHEQVHDSRSSLSSRQQQHKQQLQQQQKRTSNVAEEDYDSESEQASSMKRRGSVPEIALVEEASGSSSQSSTLSSRDQGGYSLSARHNTNSLPRLGTSAIKKTKAAAPNPTQSSSTSGGGPATLAGSLAAGPSGVVTAPGAAGARSARYKPPGYKPPPTRKISPAAVGRESPSRTFGRYQGMF